MQASEKQSLIRKKLEENINKGKKSLAAYLMLGYPDLETSRRAMIEVAKLGADIIEIGFPFSDPIADGPTIQEAASIALQQGITMNDLWDTAKMISEKTNAVPLVMTYANIPFQYGYEKFCSKALDSGIQGCIFPDMPPKYLPDELIDLHPIYLSSPLTSDSRLHELVNSTTGFLYLISHLGITGEQSNLDTRLTDLVRKVKEINSDLPVLLGFGISDEASVKRAMEMGVDGVIVGSALIKALGKDGDIQKLQALIQVLQKGLN